MHIERLVKMANDIGDFFKAEPNREEAVQGIAQHIQRFWEPRMRKQILDYYNGGGDELDALVREALSLLNLSKA